MVGTLELLGLIQEEFYLTGTFWGAVAIINGSVGWGYLGIIIVATFAITWITSYTIFKVKVESRFDRISA
jgi:high-affinity nickel-transport protein